MNSLPLLSLCALLTFSSTALSQSFNVDVGTGSLPSNAYGAAAAQPGTWVAVTAESPGPIALHDITNAATGAGLQPIAGEGNYFANNSVTSGDDEKLMDDVQDVGPAGSSASWVFTGLSAGNYKLYTYAMGPDSDTYRTSVSVPGAVEGSQVIGGNFNNGQQPGATFALHTITISNGTLTVNVIATVGYGSINGFQLKRIPDASPFTSFCSGDGSSTLCPCGNLGNAGAGCNNSQGTGGALLSATGSVNPDNVVLTVTAELPTALTIFLQGDANTAPGSVFGDGIRCAGGNLKRLYAKSAVGGTVSAPAAGDLHLRAQSAALGDTIGAGATRYYQTYYRDASPTFCSAPPGNTFNASNAVAIVWP